MQARLLTCCLIWLDMAEISSSASSSSLASRSALASAAAADADAGDPGVAPSVAPNMTWDPRLAGGPLPGPPAVPFFRAISSSSSMSFCCAESLCLQQPAWAKTVMPSCSYTGTHTHTHTHSAVEGGLMLLFAPWWRPVLARSQAQLVESQFMTMSSKGWRAIDQKENT